MSAFLFWSCAAALSLVKLLLFNSYRSTDYEVHRNWLAITHSMPIEKWYFEDTSEWTLDYPPLFAWFEFIMSHVAAVVDPAMVNVKHLNYTSPSSILFHKMSVIVTDFLFIYAARGISSVLLEVKQDASPWPFLSSSRLVSALLLIGNFGLFIVDHIHFQYNGFLFGIMLLSILRMYQGRKVESALLFATLLNFKHIYLYVAPAYFVFLLRTYCFQTSKKTGQILWLSFSIKNLLSLGFVVIMIFCMSITPFFSKEQLVQMLSRLFPFKRGLCHAYWAPNFWALYNMADKVLDVAGKQLGVHSSSASSMTGGLVQEFDHAVLPSVRPLATFILTFLGMTPALIQLWINPIGPRSFLRCLILCAFSSFAFGWHVHEKAVLLMVIPFTLLACESPREGRIFFLFSTTAHLSLFPLIFTAKEQPILYCGFFLYTTFTYLALQEFHSSKFALSQFEKLYLCGLALLQTYCGVIHPLTGFGTALPFLPLMLTSVYCAVGIMYSFGFFYYCYLQESMIIKVKQR